jgi:N-acetylglucosaminyl-diphospho-decaprenol L-rhamnosyltransferase
MTFNFREITLSVVSHLQEHLIKLLLDDLEIHSNQQIKVLLTINLNETLSFNIQDYTFPIQLIVNKTAKGFGENHNQAFTYCDTSYFCVVNPDIRLLSNPFNLLTSEIKEYNAALIAPQVVNPEHQIENSVRHFPTPIAIIKKVLFRKKVLEYQTNQLIINPDWVAGMFMLFSTEKYQLVNGFDEGYFLYYEDVDICKSLHNLNETIIYSPSILVIHAARRSSHKKLNYLLMHIKSMLRFFIKWSFRP